MVECYDVMFEDTYGELDLSDDEKEEFFDDCAEDFITLENFHGDFPLDNQLLTDCYFWLEDEKYGRLLDWSDDEKEEFFAECAINFKKLEEL